MADPINVFNSPYNQTQSWTSQGAIIQWGIGGTGFNPIPLMVSGLSMTYTQQVSSIFPLNTEGVGQATRINVKGAPQGQLQFQSIYCPDPGNLDKFLEDVTRACVGPNAGVHVTIRPFGSLSCATATDKKFINNKKFWLRDVEMVSLGVNIQAGEVTIVNMPLSFTFTALTIAEEAEQSSTLYNPVNNLSEQTA